MFKITNMTLVSDQHDLLNNIDLELNENKLHIVIGGSQSGKSVLAKSISGNSEIIQAEGTIVYNRRNITNLSSDDRAKIGIFVTDQYPPFIDGITNIEFIKIALKNIGDKRSDQDIERDYKILSLMLGLGSNHKNQLLNDHGSLRSDLLKNEMLQLLMMNPQVAVFDSIDESLENEDLEIIAEVINGFIAGKGKMCLVLTNNKTFINRLNSRDISLLLDKNIKKLDDPEEIKRIINNDNSQLL